MSKTYESTYVQEPNYLHAIATGVNSQENVANYLMEVHREGVARGAKRILIEERLEGPRLSTFEIFEIVSQGSQRAAGVFERLACVDVHAEGNMMAFAENVAVNRSVPLMVFGSVEEARRWLRE